MTKGAQRMSKFSKWLVAARKEKKLSQAQLADRVGATQAQVSQWETGKQEPKPEVIKQLQKLLAVHGVAVAAESESTTTPVAKSNGRKNSNGAAAAVLGFEQKMWVVVVFLCGCLVFGVFLFVVFGLF